LQWGLDSLIDDHIKFNLYNMFVNPNNAMYKILKPILLRFLTSTGCKRLIVDLLRSICKQTTNTLDDKAVDLLEQQLFPKLN
tara:strand:+ start:3016 stop:3261 length:246 start_codon:yes stop_codon:yes gene_type:complete